MEYRSVKAQQIIKDALNRIRIFFATNSL